MLKFCPRKCFRYQIIDVETQPRLSDWVTDIPGELPLSISNNLQTFKSTTFKNNPAIYPGLPNTEFIVSFSSQWKNNVSGIEAEANNLIRLEATIVHKCHQLTGVHEALSFKLEAKDWRSISCGGRSGPPCRPPARYL